MSRFDLARLRTSNWNRWRCHCVSNQMPQAPLLVQWLPGCAFVAANLLISFVFFCRVVMLFKMRAETACNSEFLDACTNQHKSIQAQLNGCLTNEPSPLCCWSKGECLRWSAWWLGWLGQEPHMESQDTWSQSWFECNRKFGFYAAWTWTCLAAWRQNHRVMQNKEVRSICGKHQGFTGISLDISLHQHSTCESNMDATKIQLPSTLHIANHRKSQSPQSWRWAVWEFGMIGRLAFISQLCPTSKRASILALLKSYSLTESYFIRKDSWCCLPAARLCYLKPWTLPHRLIIKGFQACGWFTCTGSTQKTRTVIWFGVCRNGLYAFCEPWLIVRSFIWM